jgi:hypothetical protein
MSIRDGGVGPLPYVMTGREWSAPPKIRKENKITLTLTNVRRVVIDAERAGLDPTKTVWLVTRSTSRTMVKVAVGDSVQTIRVAPGRHVYRVS